MQRLQPDSGEILTRLIIKKSISHPISAWADAAAATAAAGTGAGAAAATNFFFLKALE